MSSGEIRSIAVLGSSGMLGNAMLRVLGKEMPCPVYGVTRSASPAAGLPADIQERIITGIDVENFDSLVSMMERVRPSVVVNCVGLVKQKADANDPLAALPINSLLPHRLARLCSLVGARLIHISTDCVFDGNKGGYKESDTADATDLYGRSKLLGEVDYPNAITLRTSIVGREQGSRNGLIDWFLSQEGRIRGFTKAIFSGLTTIELSQAVARYVLPNVELHGLYHVSADPISKYELLVLVSEIYGRTIQIEEDPRLVIDRSLSSVRFRSATGYVPPSWRTMITELHDFYVPIRPIDVPRAEQSCNA